MDSARRRFFLGKTEVSSIRPPWSLPRREFLAHCNRCGACIRGCPQGMIGADRDGFPRMQFGRAQCSLCGECVRACETRALAAEPGARPWGVVATIGAQCLAAGNVMCRSCEDACEAGAIRFHPRLKAPALPDIDVGRCSGCGACAGVCPAGAITMSESAAPTEVA